MNAFVFYRPKSDHSRAVETYAENVYRQLGRELELIDVDSKKAQSTLKIYDIVQYPALLILGANGSVISLTQGQQALVPIANLQF